MASVMISDFKLWLVVN